MSEKLEYGDVYKFVTSIGVGLLLVSLTMPWVYLRENFDLLISKDTLNSLPLESALLIHQRQELTARIFHLLPYLSVVIFIVGVLLIIIGLRLWLSRQAWRDRAENAATQIAERQVTTMSPEQIISKVSTQAALDEELLDRSSKDTTPIPSWPLPFLEASDSYLEFERRVANQLERCISNTHSVLKNQRLGAAQFDFILEDKGTGRRDVVLELRRRVSIPSLDWWIDSVRRTAIASFAYQAATRKHAKSTLLVLFKDGLPITSDITEKLRAMARVDPSLNNVEVMPMSETDFFAESCYELRRRFEIS